MFFQIIKMSNFINSQQMAELLFQLDFNHWEKHFETKVCKTDYRNTFQNSISFNFFEKLEVIIGIYFILPWTDVI